jgi:hypothetical protein
VFTTNWKCDFWWDDIIGLFDCVLLPPVDAVRWSEQQEEGTDMNDVQHFLSYFEYPGKSARRKPLLDALPWSGRDAQIGSAVRDSDEDIVHGWEGHPVMPNPRVDAEFM